MGIGKKLCDQYPAIRIYYHRHGDMEGEVISMHDLFVFKQTGVDDEDRAVGHFWASGIRPQCLSRLEASGVRLPVEMFERRQLLA